MRASSRQTCSQVGASLPVSNVPIVAASCPSGAPNRRMARGRPPSERARSVRSFTLLLYDVIGASEDRWRNLQPERLCGLEIDHQFEFCGLLDRQIAGLGA